MVRLTCRSSDEVVGAKIRWVSRITVHRRVWSFSVTTGAKQWGEESRTHDERTMSSATIRELLGSHPGGATMEVPVRLEVVDVSPSSIMLPDFGDVTSFVEVDVRSADGSEIKLRRRVWVRPRRPHGSDPLVAAPTPPSRASSIVIHQEDPRVGTTDGGARGDPRPWFGELYRPVQGMAVLSGGAEAMPPGGLTLDLVCTATWQVHYMMPPKPELKLACLAGSKLDWKEVSMERMVREQAMKLQSVRVPAIAPGAVVEVPFSAKGPKSAAQTTETSESSIAWRVDATWTAGSRTVRSSTPVVMAMPSERRARGGPEWRRLLGIRGGQTGTGLVEGT